MAIEQKLEACVSELQKFSELLLDVQAMLKLQRHLIETLNSTLRGGLDVQPFIETAKKFSSVHPDKGELSIPVVLAKSDNSESVREAFQGSTLKEAQQATIEYSKKMGREYVLRTLAHFNVKTASQLLEGQYGAYVQKLNDEAAEDVRY